MLKKSGVRAVVTEGSEGRTKTGGGVGDGVDEGSEGTILSMRYCLWSITYICPVTGLI